MVVTRETKFSAVTTTTSSSPSGGSTKFPRVLCLLTAGMAFLLGAVVGVLLPFYVFVPALDASSNTSISAKVIPTYVLLSHRQWRRPQPSRHSSSSSSKRDVASFSVISAADNANLFSSDSSPKQFNFEARVQDVVEPATIRRRKSSGPSSSSPRSATVTSSRSDGGDSHAHPHSADSTVNEIGLQVVPNKGAHSNNRPLHQLPNWLGRTFQEQGGSSGSSWSGRRRPDRRQQIDDHDSPFVSPTSGSVRFVSPPPSSVEVFASGPYVDRSSPDERRLPDERDPSRRRGTSPVADVPSPIENLSRLRVKHEGSRKTPVVSSSPPADGISSPASSMLVVGEIVDGIFWTSGMDQVVPRGFSAADDQAWRKFVNSSLVLKIEEGCGRMQNRILTFDGGKESCCRYRQNNDQIQGEIFSFYLSRILGIGNLPPAMLGIVRGKEWQWGNVWSQLQLAQWNSEKPVVLTKFMPDLKPALIPPAFRNNNRRLYPIPEDLDGKNQSELVELVQWSDLIVFDYLTANLDRVVNNMFNQQWNAAMMKSPAHNLAKSAETGLLLFLDNESGLLHGYRLLDKYDQFHKALLDSLCIFRKPTADAISRLYHDANVGQLLRRQFHEADPGMEEWLPFIPDRHLKTLSDRIGDVYRRIRTCQAQYGPLVSS